MSCPRRLELVKTEKGYRIKQTFYPAFVRDKRSEAVKQPSDDEQREINALYKNGESILDGCVSERISKDGLHSETYMK